MIHDSRSIDAEGEELDLDPFAFWPDLGSRLIGLGGPHTSDDPDYAFHTLYAACGTGPIVFTISAKGLSSDRGTLILRVHELPEIMGANARQIAMSQTQLLEMIRDGNTVSLAAEARVGSTYAILGHIYGDCIATATSLEVIVARRAPDPNDSATPTRFRSPPGHVRTVPQLIGTSHPTVHEPASQLCTLAQLVELDLGGQPDDGDAMTRAIDDWERAYIYHALDRYDAARAGARGLGIGGLGDPLADALSQTGCSLVLTTPREGPVDDGLPAGAVAAVLNPDAIEGHAGFDFAYATRGGGIADPNRQRALRFVEDVLRTLKPGGLLVVTLPIDVAYRDIGDDAGPAMRRGDMDRIGLVLISRGHQVAQLRPFDDPAAVAVEGGARWMSAFGFVVRKAD